MKLVYTPKAREDLREIKSYISKELSSPIAAKNITDSIINECSHLKDNPLLGIDMNEKFKIETDMRYLISGNHLAFYKVDGNTVRVLRILDGRTNYMQVLFKYL